jgi:Cys-tRNA(Pro)/Cys-tRNA(Cys) deacylase
LLGGFSGSVCSQRSSPGDACGRDVVGGISPLGQRKRLPATVDESMLEWETVLVSAGRRGLQIELAPADLIRLTGARVTALTSPTRSSRR